MHNLTRFFQSILMFLLAAAALTACRTSEQTPTTCETIPGICITITESTCPSLSVTAGDQVTWINQDEQAHLIRITTAEGQVVFDSGELQTGDSASFTFPQAGSYAYICSADQESTGTLTVQP